MSGERGPLSFGDDAGDREEQAGGQGSAGDSQPPRAGERGPAGDAQPPRAGGRRAGRARGRADAEANEPDAWLPGPGTREPQRGVRARLPGIIVTLAAFLLLVVVGLNTLRTEGVSSTGPAKGDDLPPFAAPLVLSDVKGDVNLAREPDQGAAGRRPACEIRQAGVLTSCRLFRERPVVLAVFAAGERRCVEELDRLDRALSSRPGVGAAAVAVRGDRGELRRLVRGRAWSFPVAQDRDGALANVLGVAVCPQMTFVLPGGRVHDSAVGALGAAGLGARIDALARAAAR